MSRAIEADFEFELEQERLRWLRRRFMWMCGLSLGMALLAFPILFLTLPASGALRESQLVRVWWGIFQTSIYGGAMLFAVVGAKRSRTISLLALGVILFFALASTPAERCFSQIEGTFDMAKLIEETQRAATRDAAQRRAASRRGAANEHVIDAFDQAIQNSQSARAAATRSAAEQATTVHVLRPQKGVVIQISDSASPSSPNPALDFLASIWRFTPAMKTALSGIWLVFAIHLVACLFMPWTLRESSLVAAAALLGYVAVVTTDAAMGNLPAWEAMTGITAATMAVMPGLGWCWWRQSRFRREYRLRFESGRYRELRGELESARRIHESCLPAPLLTGPVRIAYAYRPMREIGGDLLFHRTTEGPAGRSHLVVVVDVTGHGIAAALTVNRLLGELERVVGEAQDATPGEVLASLNAYACLMLAEHSLYLSAIAFRMTEGSAEVTYASGGHPTAYLVSPGAGTLDLSSTAPLLGIVPPGEYGAQEARVTLGPADVIVACTDGATETTRRDGTMFRTAGMRELVEDVARSGAQRESWPAIAMRRLDAARAGEVEDDTLVVGLCIN
jgi:hypothetical protein